MEWKPIGTAPDNTMVAVKREGFCSYDRKEMYKQGVVWWHNGTWIIANPTHWMPLPEPPKCD